MILLELVPVEVTTHHRTTTVINCVTSKSAISLAAARATAIQRVALDRSSLRVGRTPHRWGCGVRAPLGDSLLANSGWWMLVDTGSHIFTTCSHIQLLCL